MPELSVNWNGAEKNPCVVLKETSGSQVLGVLKVAGVGVVKKCMPA